MGDKTNEYRVLIGKPEGMKGHMGDLDVYTGG
jgi:hypothetical protein